MPNWFSSLNKKNNSNTTKQKHSFEIRTMKDDLKRSSLSSFKPPSSLSPSSLGKSEEKESLIKPPISPKIPKFSPSKNQEEKKEEDSMHNQPKTPSPSFTSSKPSTSYFSKTSSETSSVVNFPPTSNLSNLSTSSFEKSSTQSSSSSKQSFSSIKKPVYAPKIPKAIFQKNPAPSPFFTTSSLIKEEVPTPHLEEVLEKTKKTKEDISFLKTNREKERELLMEKSNFDFSSISSSSTNPVDSSSEKSNFSFPFRFKLPSIPKIKENLQKEKIKTNANNTNKKEEKIDSPFLKKNQKENLSAISPSNTSEKTITSFFFTKKEKKEKESIKTEGSDQLNNKSNIQDPYSFLKNQIEAAKIRKQASKIKNISTTTRVNPALLSIAIAFFSLSAIFGFSYYFKIIKEQPIPLLENIIGFYWDKYYPQKNKDQEKPKQLTATSLSFNYTNFRSELLEYLKTHHSQNEQLILLSPQDNNGKTLGAKEIINFLELDFQELGYLENQEGWIFALKNKNKEIWTIGIIIKLDLLSEKVNFEAAFRRNEDNLFKKMKGLYFEPIPNFEGKSFFKVSSFDIRNRYFIIPNDPQERSLEYAFINQGRSHFLCIGTSKEIMQKVVTFIEK